MDRICNKSPLQKKKLESYLSTMDAIFFQEAEEFVEQFTGYLYTVNITIEDAIEAYLKMCQNMLRSQIKFMKTGCYPVSQSAKAFETVYSNEKEMTSYMIGLAISQFLWGSHYEMFRCFKEYLIRNTAHIHTYLEIGPGHGLFLNKALYYLQPQTKISVVEISQISLKITQSIVSYFGHSNRNIAYYNTDILQYDLSERYDFITMGEVLEHVNVPEKLLFKLKELLSSDGKVFISTCVNCPAIDHVYHFKTIDEIRIMFQACGFEIEHESILPVEDLPFQEILEKKITINYCAILTKE